MSKIIKSNNPFIKEIASQFKTTEIKRLRGTELITDMQSGEVLESQDRFVYDRKLTDKASYFKCFHDKFPIVMRFSLPEYKLYMYIGYNLGIKADDVVVNVDELMVMAEWKSISMYYKAVRGLTAKGIIHKTGTFTFKINPGYFFNGDRVKLYRETIEYKDPIRVGDHMIKEVSKIREEIEFEVPM